MRGDLAERRPSARWSHLGESGAQLCKVVVKSSMGGRVESAVREGNCKGSVRKGGSYTEIVSADCGDCEVSRVAKFSASGEAVCGRAAQVGRSDRE